MRGEGRPLPGGALVLVVLSAAVALIAAVSLASFGAPSAAAADPHAPCDDGVTGITGSADLVTYDAGSDTITAVCIKSGANMFNGEHKLVTSDGVVANCYTVSGIGTSKVKVQRTGTAGPDCQAISHIDVLTGPAPTPTSTPQAPEATPTGTPAAAGATATPTSTPHVLGEEEAPEQFPETGQGASPSTWDGLALVLGLSGLGLLGGAAALAAVAVRRRR
ncbi:MAG: hypothetical protein HYS09_07755 [Chloroflexi bacterium]|nr:hypothetical protein [Chloroflexota bacterium]